MQGPKEVREAALLRKKGQEAAEEVDRAGSSKDLLPGLYGQKAVTMGSGWKGHMGMVETSQEAHYKEASR